MSSPYAETDYSRYGLRRNGSHWVAADQSPKQERDPDPYRADFGERTAPKRPLNWMDTFQVKSKSALAPIQTDRQRPSHPEAGDHPDASPAHLLAYLRRTPGYCTRKDLLDRHAKFGCARATVPGAIRALVDARKISERSVRFPGDRRATLVYLISGRQWPMFPDGAEIVKPRSRPDGIR